MARTVPLALGKNDWERRLKALEALAEGVGAFGLHGGPSYTVLVNSTADAADAQPELTAALMSIVRLLPGVELSDKDKEHLLKEIEDLKARFVAFGLEV